ncbi:hypothetical protein BOX15_Mlig002213g4 [Macrostomum lignano]|uniref:Uncharacterized protein n=2 Tax=Macrostomum lignano TaxID=282301 RepID=A0A267FJ47_9PLAT|nr:hypothetical protein BOX15_Mlig026826g1 [Macrostomum lignano]PAA94228.1 hypothetical protein BOX15_Mlig002213g4 [Macrostomum lignano]
MPDGEASKSAGGVSDEVGVRVKFNCRYLGRLEDWWHAAGTTAEQREKFDANLLTMACALEWMQDRGAAPVAPDGRLAGNAAAVLARTAGGVGGDDQLTLLVSRSGRAQGPSDTERDFCVVTSFDFTAWSCGYYASSSEIQPTSDTPLHWSALLESRTASVSLHGHAFETEAKAAAINVPCSNVETLFSTPEDTAALVELMRQHPYPRCRMYIRRGHGFVILGSSFPQAEALLDAKLHILRVGKPSKRQWLLAAVLCVILSACVSLLVLR